MYFGNTKEFINKTFTVEWDEQYIVIFFFNKISMKDAEQKNTLNYTEKS
jgi:hypothetical protein